MENEDTKEIFRIFPAYYELSEIKKKKILTALMEWVEMEINHLEIRSKKTSKQN